MSLGSAIGQVDSGIFNDLLVAPHFVDITLSPIKVAPREGAIAYDEKTKLLYYSSNYKWIPINGSGFGPGGAPQGILTETTPPSGTTFVGSTIVSSTTAITVTNGNGVGGNPTLTFNPATAGITALDVSVLPAGLLIGPTLQDDINYLGQMFNVNNGFSVYNAQTPEVVIAPGTAPNTPIIPLSISGPGGIHPYGYNSDPGFDITTGIYTVQPDINGALRILFRVDTSVDYSTVGTSIGGMALMIQDLTAGTNINARSEWPNRGAPPISPTGASEGSVGFGGNYLLNVGSQYAMTFSSAAGNTTTILNCHWSMRRLQ
jgi:hypothetical protein